MPVLETTGKATLFAVAISAITAGIKIIEIDLWTGVALLLVGVALIVVWAYLVERQARKAGERAAEKIWRRMKEECGKKTF